METRQARQARKCETGSGPAPATAAVPSNPAEIVREAYLRTLSRLPNEREAGIAGTYFSESGDTGKGLRDLLWALLNTKEFITNH